MPSSPSLREPGSLSCPLCPDSASHMACPRPCSSGIRSRSLGQHCRSVVFIFRDLLPLHLSPLLMWLSAVCAPGWGNGVPPAQCLPDESCRGTFPLGLLPQLPPASFTRARSPCMLETWCSPWSLCFSRAVFLDTHAQPRTWLPVTKSASPS